MATKIIGIAGGAGSGKTTLTQRLHEFLQPGAEVITLDQFFLTDQTGGPFISSPLDGQRYFDMNHPDAFDLPRIMRRIEELSRGEGAAKYILVDGMFSLALDELRQKLSLKVFVLLEDDIRLGRKVVRNYQERGKDPSVTLQNYLNSGRPGHDLYVAHTAQYADLMLYGGKNPDENARVIATLIRHWETEKL